MQTSLVARVFGFRLLTVEGTVLLSPTEGASATAARPSSVEPASVLLPRASPPPPAVAGSRVGGGLSRAADLLVESAELLEEPAPSQ